MGEAQNTENEFPGGEMPPFDETAVVESAKSLAARVYARTRSLKTAAKRADISVDALRLWIDHDPEFRGLLVEAQTEPVMKTVSAIQFAAPIAVRVLKEELEGDANAEGSTRRINAAKVVLEHFYKMTELITLVQRVHDLEFRQRQRDSKAPLVVEAITSGDDEQEADDA